MTMFLLGAAVGAVIKTLLPYPFLDDKVRAGWHWLEAKAKAGW